MDTDRPSQAVLRPLWISELPLLWKGLKALAEFESKEAEFICTESWLSTMIFGPDPQLMAYMFWEYDQLVGFVTLFTTLGTFAMNKKCFIEDLFIWPQYRNRGLGKKLMLAIKEVVKSNGYQALEWKVLHWNTKAKIFYDSIGACPDRDWIAYSWK